MSQRRRRRSSSGFTLAEIIAALGILAIVITALTPLIQSIMRREKLRSSVREVYSIVLAARMQAVKRNTNAIVFFDVANHQVTSWVDQTPFNFVQDVGEPTLASYHVPDYIYFRMAPLGAAVNDATSVAFDTYAGNATRVDMVIFQGDGTLLAPQAPDSVRPLRPSAYTATVPYGSVNCKAAGGSARGIYMSNQSTTGDVNDRDTFRISVDDFGSSGKASLLKWLPTTEGGNAGEYDYVPSPWKWAN